TCGVSLRNPVSRTAHADLTALPQAARHVMSIKPENFDTFFGYVDSIDIKSPLNHYVSIF
ncbi:hypothetical protein, partial [Thalassospira xiamenensis]|uniref:hypothetical protein n=1 Tax=Thalassospira xiamenensis TaxID=220697 RepID=UPI00241D3091